jgi:hypothetical protein
MTKMLDRAIERVRELSDTDQDEAAEILLWVVETRGDSMSLDEETVKAIEDGIAAADRGDFASQEEIAALWKRHGL